MKSISLFINPLPIERSKLMETLEVGKSLVALCREGRFTEAIDQHYSESIVSIEGMTAPGMEKRMQGLDAIKGKTQRWIDNHEVHSMTAEGPFVAEGSNQFMVRFSMDVTKKQTGRRQQGQEVGIYTVVDGKVAHEEFYFLGA